MKMKANENFVHMLRLNMGSFINDVKFLGGEGGLTLCDTFIQKNRRFCDRGSEEGLKISFSCMTSFMNGPIQGYAIKIEGPDIVA